MSPACCGTVGSRAVNCELRANQADPGTMLHEVLLALMGAPGYVIREGTDCFELNPGVAESFLHPSEVALVAKISGLGYHYKALERYTQSVLVGMLSFEPQPEAEPSSPAAPPPTRIYTRAVAAAVDELLQLYCDAVADAESEFLEDHALPLTHLQYLLRDQAVSLPAVHALVQRIESRGLRGGKIIDEVQKSSFSGVPAIEAATARILSSAHELLLNHMIGWMVHGDISELSHHEFFVKDALLDRARQGSQVGANSEPIHEWHNRFSLRLDMLPGCIPLAVAEKIVFIGKAMRVLSQRSQLVSLDDKRQFTASLGALLRDSDAGIGDSNNSDDGGAGGEAARQSEGKADAAVAAPATVATRRISFKPIELSCTISALRGTAAKLLWQLVVQDSNLLKPLHAMRDYYLLAKGDFFQYFIQECLEKNLLGQQPRPAGSGNLSAELKKLWQVAATNSGVEEDDDFQRLSVELRTPAKASADVGGAASSSDTWRQLSLSMEPAWPLDFLLSEPMQSRYNELFPLLFTVKRVQMALHAVWMPLVQVRHCSFSYTLIPFSVSSAPVCLAVSAPLPKIRCATICRVGDHNNSCKKHLSGSEVS